MTTITYQVPNISCHHCVHTIKTELGELKGVKEVEADVSTQNVKISFDPPATSEAIENLLAEMDYPVKK